MKGIYWLTLTLKKSVINLIKVNYTSNNDTPCDRGCRAKFASGLNIIIGHTDIKNLPAFMVYVPVSQELGPIFQVNPRDMRSY